MPKYVEKETIKEFLKRVIFGADQKLDRWVDEMPDADVCPAETTHNIAEDYDDCDQFVCYRCGMEFQGWTRVDRDEDDGDITYHEYVFRYCPHCGAKVKEP